MSDSMSLNQELISRRRYLHQHPEIAGQEINTAKYLVRELKKLGLSVEENIFGHGLVAKLNAKEKGKCIALRADMDALPIMEQTGLTFKSINDGVMHACGHDAHMAIILGVAAELAQNPPQGEVKFIFQPSEEKPPGGAKYMIEAGVLNDPSVDAVLGLHVSPAFPVGTIALKEGALMAIADDFTLTIKGRGGHGATPHQAVDPITVTAQVIQGLQHVISRRINPNEPALLSIGTIHGGTSQNIIPDEVVMTGTIRCTSQEVKAKIIQEMKQALSGITQAWGADYQLDYLHGYPPVINDPKLALWFMEIVKNHPHVNLEVMAKPFMIGEDFAYFGQNVPALYFFLGCGSDEKNHPLHHNCFDLEEACLPIGAEVIIDFVYNFMETE